MNSRVTSFASGGWSTARSELPIAFPLEVECGQPALDGFGGGARVAVQNAEMVGGDRHLGVWQAPAAAVQVLLDRGLVLGQHVQRGNATGLGPPVRQHPEIPADRG